MSTTTRHGILFRYFTARTIGSYAGVLLIFLLGSIPVVGQTEQRREVTGGGGEVMRSDNFRVHGTLSQTSIGRTRGADPARHNVGFWYWARAEVPAVLLSIPTVEADAGDTVEIPVSITESRDLQLIAGEEFSLSLRFNGSLLEPIDPGVTCRFENGACILSLKGRLPEFEGELLSLRFRARLGNAPTTPIEIGAFSLDSERPVSVLRRHGEFRLLDLCEIDGTRLVFDGYETRVSSVIPNPVSTTTTVSWQTAEDGPVELFLVDQLGRTVDVYLQATFENGAYTAQIDLSDQPVGSYFLVLRTGTEQALHAIEVMR